ASSIPRSAVASPIPPPSSSPPIQPSSGSNPKAWPSASAPPICSPPCAPRPSCPIPHPPPASGPVSATGGRPSHRCGHADPHQSQRLAQPLPHPRHQRQQRRPPLGIGLLQHRLVVIEVVERLRQLESVLRHHRRLPRRHRLRRHRIQFLGKPKQPPSPLLRRRHARACRACFA